MDTFELLDLKEGSVHVWQHVFEVEGEGSKRYFELLSDVEKHRAGRFKFNKDRECFVIARGMLRIFLGRYAEVSPTEIIFEYSEYNKPIFLNEAGVDFNISHSGNRIVFAFSKGMTIGVDIEKVKSDFDTLELAENFFSSEEIKALSSIKSNERPQAFFRCWTRKESFIKAVGQGLSYPLDSFAVSIDNDLEADFLKIDGVTKNENVWQLRSFVPADGYIAALTTSSRPEEILFFDCENI